MERKIWLTVAFFFALLGGRAYVADMGKSATEETSLQSKIKEETKEMSAEEKMELSSGHSKSAMSADKVRHVFPISSRKNTREASDATGLSSREKWEASPSVASVNEVSDIYQTSAPDVEKKENARTDRGMIDVTQADRRDVGKNAILSKKSKKKGEERTISPEHPLTILADELKYQSTSGDVSAQGDVDMTHMAERYRTERIYGNNKTQHFVIPETVYWTAPGNTAEAKSAEYDGLSGISTFSEFSGWHRGLYYYSGTDGVYDRKTNVATVQNAYFTTKSAVARVPDYRIEADSIDIYPGNKYVAHHPSLFIKNTRLITLGSYTGSLRHDGISIWSLLPTPIYDSHNGFGFKNAFEMPLGRVESDLYFYTRFAWYSKQGLIPDIGLRYETPQGTLRFRYAKVESTSNDYHIWLEKRPSLAFHSRNYYIKNTHLYAGFGGELGYWKQKNGPEGSHKMWEVWLRHDPIRLGSHLSLHLGVGYIHDYYGYQNSFRKNAYYTAGLSGNYGILNAWVNYTNNNQVGRTPYAFDTYDMTKPISTGFRVQLTPKDAFSINYSIDTVNGVLNHRDYTYCRDMHSFTGWIQYRSVDQEWNIMIQPKDFTF